MIDKRYVIGIDLGTTNCAVAYVSMERDPSKKPDIHVFRVPQLTGPGEWSSLPVLPSFLYIPGAYDISKDAVSIPWNRTDTFQTPHFVGAFARDHGAKIPSRLVSSAKSWLCHAAVDRHARILPWDAGDDVSKVSPVQATAAYLEHIKHAWNSGKKDDEEEYLEHQIVIITVPASFDEVARDLTVEAATLAGLKHVTLLEEPLAAFYSWLMRHEQSWNRFVQEDELILICDVGGGTTDFTLITLRNRDGSPRFERIAVGDHLILGGDNIDRAIARLIEAQLNTQNMRVTPDRWKTLCHECRKAKEILLDGHAESRRITLMGEGSKLIAGTISVDLKRDAVAAEVLDGFFPLFDKTIRIIPKDQPTDSEFGLPYEKDPAVTRHIIEFLQRHEADVSHVLKRNDYSPDLILFNGGSLRPVLIQERIGLAIRRWFKKTDEKFPRVLENAVPDLAVALGAAYYGLVKMGQGVRVGSGSARSYFLRVDRMHEEKQHPEKKYAVCLVERGMEEGTTIALADNRYEVLTNQPVTFDMFSSSFRSGDRTGQIVDIDDTLTALPPLQTIIQYGKKEIKTALPVGIEAAYSEMGMLSIWCRSLISDHRWQLRFQLRRTTPAQGVLETEIFDTAVTESLVALIRRSLSENAEDDSIDMLTRGMEEILGRSKDQWPLGLIRTISDYLLELKKQRTVGPEYESRWLNLVGFCMRPGFGDGFDPYRIKTLWKVYLQGPIHPKHARVRLEWWIIWRRVAGGMKPGQQRQFLQDIGPVISARKESTTGRIPPQERVEAWMALANMEQLFVKDKIKWGRILLSEIKPRKSRPQHFWALSRIGARQLLYGPLDRVIPPEEVASWIEQILSMNWRNPKPVCSAVVQLARRTGDRTRDVDASVIRQIIKWMPKEDTFRPYLRYITDIVAMEKQEETAIFGESMPSGLVLQG